MNKTLDLSPFRFLPYDVFGYLLPGAVLGLAGCLGNVWFRAILTRPAGTDVLAWLILLVVLAYVAGHVVASLASHLLERWLLRWVFRYPSFHMFGPVGANKGRWWDLWWKLAERWRERLVWAWKLPIEILCPEYCRSLSPGFIDLCTRGFQGCFGFVPDDAYDYFWLAWHVVSLRHRVAFERASHLLDLYGFARNVSMSFLLAAFIPRLPGWVDSFSGRLWFGVCFAAFVVLYSNYMHLLRRMNTEVFRGFAVVASIRDTATASKPADRPLEAVAPPDTMAMSEN